MGVSKRFDSLILGLRFVAGAIALWLIIGSTVAAAQSDTAANRVFNKDLPVTIDTLPPGKLRTQINSLPASARERAFGWLRRFEFPKADVDYLRADPRGGIFYEDPIIGGVEVGESSGSTPLISDITEVEAFTLHSKPGASRTVYLDMDGHVVTGTIWNSNSGFNVLFMRPFDKDGNEGSFSQTELDEIAENWKRVAEDFAPFDIDVTTEEPPAFGPDVGHIIVTRKMDEYNNEIYNCNCGGVAYVGVWGRSNYTYYQPALVFLDGVSSPHSVSEAASHELGHNLSLSHDGNNSTGYYRGHGSGYIDWAPIMGVGYYAHVTQWSKGEYTDANNLQDDLNIIGGHLTYRTDTHEDLYLDQATPLVRTNSTDIVATNPVTDPDNLNPNNKGIIEDRSDVDLFYIDVGAGQIDLTVKPAWIDSFTGGQGYRGMNLDIQLSLYDENGNLIAMDNIVSDTYAQITTSVNAGRYYLAVEGVGYGSPVNGYSDYGSLGQYFINGTVPEDIVYTAPPTAPGDVTATLNGENNILINWTDPESTPETNEAGYRLFRQVYEGQFAEIVTLGRDSESYSDNNLANGFYAYQVEAYNGAGSNWSNITQSLQVAAPVVAHATSETTLSGSILNGSYLDTTMDSGSEQLSENHQGGKPSRRVSALEHIWTVTGVQPGALVTLNVVAEALANSEGDDFEFSYSLDGNSYTPFALLENGTGEQPLSEVLPLPADTNGMVMVRVKDTNRTTGNGQKNSVIISLIEVVSAGDPGEQIPVVEILEPIDGFQVVSGTSIIFSATANDFEDGDISGNVSWSSNRDGIIGNGANLVVDTLSMDRHVITASVTDTAGKVGEDSISVTVNDPNSPTSVSVLSLDGNSYTVRKKWTAEVTVGVKDNIGNTDVPDATVIGNWSSGGTGSCNTGGQEVCTITKGGLNSRVSSVTFTITTIEHSSLAFDNSGQSEVTVTKP